MKKKLAIWLLVVFFIVIFSVTVNAESAEVLSNKLYNKLAPYGMTNNDRVKVERYLEQYPVTDEEADVVFSMADQMVELMNKAGTNDISKISNEEKQKVKDIAIEAASTVGATLVFKPSWVEIYRDGKLVESVKYSNGKLVYTGNNINFALITVVLVVVVLTLTLILKKKKANK